MAEANQEPDLAHFQKIPWCAQLLSSPNITITPTYSRQYKASTEDALFAETLKTNDTIRAGISFHPRHVPGAHQIEEVHTLLTLGYRLNGHPGRAHGGVLASVMDEVMASLLSINKRMGLVALRGDTLTAYLNVSYVKPVGTPGTVLVSARFKEIMGRKHFLEATIKGGDGVVLSRAEALFIVTEKPSTEERL